MLMKPYYLHLDPVNKKDSLNQVERSLSEKVLFLLWSREILVVYLSSNCKTNKRAQYMRLLGLQCRQI